MAFSFDPEFLLHTAGAPQSFRVLRKQTSRRKIENALATGRIRKLKRGMYALPEVDAVLQAAALNSAALSHLSAVRYWQLPSLHPINSIWLTVGKNRHARFRDKLIEVRYADLRDDELETDQGGIRVTSPVKTVLDCSTVLSFVEALAIADGALRRGMVEPEALLRAAFGYRGRGSRQARSVAEHASAFPMNPFESALRGLCIEAGFSQFVPQLPVRDQQINYHLDLGDPVNRLALEADGFQWHGNRKALHRDCTRYNELVRRGWRVLRFSWESVMFEPEWVKSVIADALGPQIGQPRRTR